LDENAVTSGRKTAGGTLHHLGEKTVRMLLIAVVILMSAGGTAAASDNDDVMEIARRWTDAFNRGAFNTDVAPCAEDAVVIDDLQPHVWQGPVACSRWYKAVAAWTEKAAVTKPTIAIGKAHHLDFDAGYAYLVAPVMLSYIKAAKAVNFRGIITMTLHKGESGWRVSGVAWADE
jgi:ketosteroid isomerase-like protein